MMSSKMFKQGFFLLAGLLVIGVIGLCLGGCSSNTSQEESSASSSHKAPAYANYIIGDYAGEWDITAVVTDGKTAKVAEGTVKASDNRISLDDGNEKITGTYRQKVSSTSFIYNDTRGRFLSFGSPEGIDWATVLTITDASGNVQKSYYLEKADAQVEGADEFAGDWKIDHGSAGDQTFTRSDLDPSTRNMTLRLTKGGSVLIIDDSSGTAAVNHYEVSDGQIKVQDDSSNINYSMKRDGEYLVWSLSDDGAGNSAEYYMTKE